MAQETINVGTSPNDGLGDPLRTAFTKCNENFSELYSRVQTTPPTSLVGVVGDQAGMYAYDETYFYYCFANYDGSTVIWAQVTQVGNIALTSIINGDSNVSISGSGANVTVSANGTANVAVFSDAGASIDGTLEVTGNSTLTHLLPAADATYDLGGVGSVWRSLYLSGNTIYLGDGQITGNATEIVLGTTTVSTTGGISAAAGVSGATLSTAGNVTGGNLRVNGDSSMVGNVVVDESVHVVGNISTDAYFVGTFVGNITGNFVVPGGNTWVLFNTNGNTDASQDFTFDSATSTVEVDGIVSATGNIVGGDVYTGGVVSATGNVTGGNILTGGAVSATGNLNSGNVITTSVEATTLSASGNVTGGNIRTGGLISATGNLDSGNVNTTLVSATGNVRGASGVFSAGMDITGNVDVTGNVNVTGNLNYANVTDLVVGDPLIYIGANNTGNVYDLGMVLAWDDGVYQHGGLVRDASDGTFKLFGNVVDEPTTTVNFANAIYQPLLAGAITSTGAVSATGNVTGGNIITGGVITAVGNITGDYIIGNGSQLTGLPAGYANSNAASYLASGTVSTNILTTAAISATGNVTGGNIRTSGLITATGNITGGNISITAVSAATISASGNVTGGNVITSGLVSTSSITKTGSNGVGNIGSSSNYFNQIFATATTALYADLAEAYLADADYSPGTVVSFGGEREVTMTTVDSDSAVAGVVSTNPAYHMNAGLQGDHVCHVALVGRVNCQVVGPVNKGSLMVAAGDGRARACTNPAPGTIIGKSLENFDGDHGVIEVVVGRV